MNEPMVKPLGEKDINFVVDLIKNLGEKKIRFVVLFGSISVKKQTPLSDVDLAVYYDGSKEERFRFRMDVLGRISDKFDVQTFQDLPLYIQKEVVKGRVLYCDDSRFLYEIVRRTSQDFDDFKIKFYDYIQGGVIA